MLKLAGHTINFILLMLTIALVIPLQTALALNSSQTDNLLTIDEKAWLEQHPILKVGGPKSFPPFAFFDNNGEPQGIAYDYLALMMGQFGVKLEIKNAMPWTEVLSKAQSKEIDIVSCVAKTPDREKFLSFSEPYLSFPLVIISRRDSQFIGGLNDLRGVKVAMVKKNVVYEWLNRDGIEVIYHFEESALECIKAVSSGRAEAYIDNLASATYFIEKYGLSNLKVAAPTKYHNYDLHFAIRQDFPQLVSIINKSLNKLTKEQHTGIRNRWLSVRYEYGITPQEVKKWGVILGVPLLAVIAVIILWNRRLKSEIAQRKSVEDALKESQRRYREIFENSRDGFVFIDTEGRLITANQAYCNMLGYKLDELKEKDNIHDLTPAHWREWEMQEIYEKQLIKDGYSGIYNKEYIRKDGTIFPVEIQAYAFFNGNSYPNYIWAIARDITTRKFAEEERERLLVQLNQAQKMESIGRLAGGIAHDFNNMLGVILGQAELAMTQVDNKEQLKHKLTQIRNAAERSANLTRQLLAYARKQIIVPKVLDLNETIEGMLRMLRSLMGDSIEIVWLPGNALWQIKVDPSQVDQIMTNLCVNAKDAIFNLGKDSGKVIIETKNISFDDDNCCINTGFLAGDYVQLAVSDDGCGMGKETVDKIFEPFFTTKEFGKGTGLGLATVYGIVKQNRGFINVYSETNMGTSFKIYLPKYNNNYES